jgi:hypothetical protein
MHRSFSGILWGLIFIALGTVMLLDRFDYLEFDLGSFLGTWWPAILIVIGLGMLLDRPRERKSR